MVLRQVPDTPFIVAAVLLALWLARYVSRPLDRLALLIADVSGKGISAALFMAVSRTLLKDACRRPTAASKPGTTVTTPDGAKGFPGKRPWMISHLLIRLDIVLTVGRASARQVALKGDLPVVAYSGQINRRV